MKKAFLIILITFFSLLAYLSVWYKANFGQMDFEQIVFHLYMPLKNAEVSWTKHIQWCFICAFLTAVACSTLHKIKYIFYILLGLIFFDCFCLIKFFNMMGFLKSQFQSSKFIEEHYVKPQYDKIVFPKDKKNLIILMVESLETSYQDIKNGGVFKVNYIPELTDLAQKNISFSFSDKIEGAFVPPEAGWTIAATVAQTAGIPLKLYGKKDNNKERKIDNSLGQFSYFLPGAITLGDILHYNGYNNYFVLGTDASFAGKEDYFKQHGQYKIIDKAFILKNSSIKPKFVKDKDLFNYCKDILNIIKKEAPFSVLIQTNNTHYGSKKDFQQASVEVSAFIKWIQKQDFFKNTVVVVVGDHCNMNQGAFKKIENDNFRYNGNIKRKVYNVFINPTVLPKKMKHRKFSTLDMFPTILASLGASVPKDRLGLGTNLFSDTPTLLETYETEYIFRELNKKSPWYDRKLLFKQKNS